MFLRFCHSKPGSTASHQKLTSEYAREFIFYSSVKPALDSLRSLLHEVRACLMTTEQSSINISCLLNWYLSLTISMRNARDLKTLLCWVFPTKFSLYLHSGSQSLETICDNWTWATHFKKLLVSQPGTQAPNLAPESLCLFHISGSFSYTPTSRHQ